MAHPGRAPVVLGSTLNNKLIFEKRVPLDRLVTSRYDPVGPSSTAMTHPLRSTGFRPRGWSRLCFAGHSFLRSEGLLCLFASAQVIHRQSTPLSVCSTPRTTSRP